MLSTKTILSISEIIESLNKAKIDRIISVFDFPDELSGDDVTKVRKSTGIFKDLKNSTRPGTFSADLKIDILQYLVDKYHDDNPGWENGDKAYSPTGPGTSFANAFSEKYTPLSNSLKRDGYIIEGRTIKKLLPDGIVDKIGLPPKIYCESWFPKR